MVQESEGYWHICEYELCGKVFHPFRPEQRFCCARHASRYIHLTRQPNLKAELMAAISDALDKALKK